VVWYTKHRAVRTTLKLSEDRELSAFRHLLRREGNGRPSFEYIFSADTSSSDLVIYFFQLMSVKFSVSWNSSGSMEQLLCLSMNLFERIRVVEVGPSVALKSPVMRPPPNSFVLDPSVTDMLNQDLVEMAIHVAMVSTFSTQN
jgi:hypothetical protein